MQTTAIDKLQLLPIANLVDKITTTKLIDWLKVKSILPYGFTHLDPVLALQKVENMIPSCRFPQDCVMYFNSWVRGVSGIVYTQLGFGNTKNPHITSSSKNSAVNNACPMLSTSFGINVSGLSVIMTSKMIKPT
mmetsp:Transcript_22440/g.30739  ORF Transcript_22440/g.30739 Transcript_22440/m.30739 type:complete len:134 (+) Transcript_22440:82-483(+)